MADCKTIQKMIIPFEQDELSLADEEIFIQHLEECDDCREEFEIHYIVTYGLSDDDDFSEVKPEYQLLLNCYDFKGLVDLKIENSKEKVQKIRHFRRISELSWVLANLCMLLTIAVFIIIRYY
jgi:CRISPR/Cas system-associated protein Cas10 (large subunit of type III CRISPR-Cas system)